MFADRAGAQTSTTSLQGTVTDPSGAAVANATVELTNADSKTQRDATTDAQGEYHFLFLPPGTYSLSISAIGFSRFEQKGLQLLVNTPATVNAQLHIGQTSQVITVSDAPPALNMVDASIGDTFNETHVKQIPIEGRNVPDLLSLQPGVAYTGNRPDADKDNDTRGGAVNGARSDQSNVTLDGVDVNDFNSAYAFTSVLPVTLDSVQEFRVTTTNYNADQGQGSGAEVAMVTKSGSNNLHGTAYEYTRNTITSANDYLLKASQLNAGLPNKPDKLIRNIFGASLGGPIRKNRLFLFGNYEGTRQREQETVVRTIPTPTLCQGHIRYVNTSNTITDLAPSDIANLDPNKNTGINPAIENGLGTGYFDTTFCTGKTPTNDPSVGDGLNYSGFRFPAPVSRDNNAVIARLDYNLTANGRQSLFVRGALQNLSDLRPPFLPGSAPETTILDHSKGIAVGYTAQLSNNLANTFHYGLTRQSTAFIGNSDQKPWNQFLGLDQGITYSHSFQMPVHNLTDDLSWTKGSHTLQFGGTVGIARNPRLSFQHSWPTAFGTTSWMAPTGFANTGGGSTLDPANKGYPEPLNSVAYDYPMLSLLGMVSQMVGNYNYDRSGSTLAPGTPVKRDYGLNWYGMYAQDAWRIKPNLTLTLGLRWELLPPPWEVNGLQASPSVDMGKLFDQQAAAMKQGTGYEAIQPISFLLGGPANHGSDFYQFEKADFAPRISVAYSPRFENGVLKSLFGTPGQTVIRAGFAKVFDRPGMQLINTFDQNAPAGLAATVQNPCCIPITDGAENVPRITNINVIPTNDLLGLYNPFLPPAPDGTFPQTPPTFGQAITWGVDQSLKTPHAYTIDFSIGRELPGRFTLQVAYVGRVARKLLTQRDLMQPLDLVDPKTGIDYFSAAARMSQLGRQGIPVSQISDATVGATAAFWHDMLPPLPNGAQYQTFAYLPSPFTTPDLMQAIYNLYTTTDTYPGNEVVGLGNIDLYYALSDTLGNYYDFGNSQASPNPAVGDMLNGQFTSMYGWSSVGTSNYNALQTSLRRQLAGGVEFEFNYTYSKSIDITSAAARVGYNGGINGSQLVNAFAPNQNRAVSDFDTTHQLNTNWLVELPFGKGRRFARDAGNALDALIGGWQIWGLARWTSGFPFSVGSGQAWATDWNYSGLATMISKPKTGAYAQPDGSVSVFADPASAHAGFDYTYPGQSGTRNALRGPGYASWDMSLSKRWNMPWEGHSLQFRAEVFNVANLHRFNVQSFSSAYTLQQLPQSFGDFTSLLTQPRVMQFALRYEF
ncbi:MAG TPA: carboxypeptidase-like regulatory domain-containing protein [Terriglobales bacterium]|nr:carboxypeptidase-like regulatory domain-containing protein [Terriglobales bacterium]